MTATAQQAADAGGAATAFPDHGAAIEAHRALLNDSSIQFDLPIKGSERHPPPDWLRAAFQAVRDFGEWVGPAWPYILWGLVALLVLVAVFVFFEPARAWLRERLGRGGKPEAEPAWMPEQAAARRLLDEADALAAEGRYDEAVRLVLFRSIADIDTWRTGVVRPSLTARDIAAVDALPGEARGVFARIVAAVERSLFARRPLSRGDWEAARGDYARFALGTA